MIQKLLEEQLIHPWIVFKPFHTRWNIKPSVFACSLYNPSAPHGEHINYFGTLCCVKRPHRHSKHTPQSTHKNAFGIPHIACLVLVTFADTQCAHSIRGPSTHTHTLNYRLNSHTGGDCVDHNVNLHSRIPHWPYTRPRKTINKDLCEWCITYGARWCKKPHNDCSWSCVFVCASPYVHTHAFTIARE